MISVSTFVSALALVAAMSAVVASITLWTRVVELESARSTMLSNLKACVASLVDVKKNVLRLQSTAPSTLAAEVAALREAVDKLADTQRRFQGRFDATRKRDPDPEHEDEELNALIALQSAPTPQPK